MLKNCKKLIHTKAEILLVVIIIYFTKKKLRL